MIVGIASAKAAIESVVGLAGSVLGIVSEGLSFKDVPNLIKLIHQAKSLFASGTKALEEIRDLDDKEAAELGRAFYEAAGQVLALIQEYKKGHD